MQDLTPIKLTPIKEAVRLHLAGDMPAAEALYREIIGAHPNDAPARHYLGFLLQQTERLTEARQQLTAAIALDDSQAQWHFNLGIVLSKLGKTALAIESFSGAIAIDPGSYFYWTNLGAAFEADGQWQRAEQCYLAASKIDAQIPDAFYMLAALCVQQQRFAEARQYNYRGIVVAPENSTSKIIRGQAYYELGRVSEAIALFEKWLAAEPDNPVAMHLLAAYRGERIPEQCQNDYVEQTFDEFAATFDNILGRLKYSGPQLVRDYLGAQGATRMEVLDLGCGTGLVGDVLMPYSSELTGVDLSGRMLAQAREKNIYQQLHQGDIGEFLRATDKRYDLISCMDTLIYLGRLDAIMPLIYARLKTGGRFLFSTEKLMGESDYKLNVSGRYSHHPAYLSALLATNGFEIVTMDDVTIRIESGCPIEGQFLCARRTTDSLQPAAPGLTPHTL